jgi:lactate dehydrogenase-like 2-hydroxyacid dehydrogenase
MIQIIIINKKKEFSSEQIKKLSASCELSFIEHKNFQHDRIWRSNHKKIIAINPELTDWVISKSFIESVVGLKAVCLPTTSFSWIDGVFLRKLGILLTNVPHYSTESVAEYAINLMLNIAKKLPLIIRDNWTLDYSKHLGVEVKGKIMGIIGLGHIGSRIAEIGYGLGMNVVYWSKYSRDKRFTYLPVNEVLRRSDFIFPTMARNEKTDNFLNKVKIRLMKKNSYIVSVTGDDLFDLDFAVAQHKKGLLAGIAFESGKYKVTDYSFKSFEGNIYVTPPIAWYTKEALEEDFKIWVDSMISITKNKPINIVN